MVVENMAPSFPRTNFIFLETSESVKAFVARLCQTLCDPVDCGPSDPSVHGTPMQDTLLWGSSQRIQVSRIAGLFYCLRHQGRDQSHQEIWETGVRGVALQGPP